MPAQPARERVFVGRATELAELRSGLDAVLAGGGRSFSLTGDAGIGKTRLAWEFTREARARGALVCWGRCWEAGGAPSYWPWVEVLRQVLASADPTLDLSSPQAGVYLAQLVPEAAGRFGVSGAPQPSPTDPDSARFLMFDAVAGLLRKVAARTPVVVVIDDLHAADRASLLVLAFLARGLCDARIMFVSTYREIEASSAADLSQALTEMGRQARRLSLRGLTSGDVCHLIESAAGCRPSDALVTRIHDATDGNPFFIDEVLRVLAADGRLGPSAEPPSSLGIPDGVREAVRRRLVSMPPESVVVLELAAVIGREFDASTVQVAGAGGDLLHVLEALESPVRQGLVVELPGAVGRFQFRHALIREVLYGSLAPARRLRLHHNVGEALAKISDAEPDRYVAEVAHHFLVAAPCGGGEEFVEYGRRAAQRALARMAFEEAVALYQRTIDALVFAGPDDRRRCELLLALGEAKEWANDGTGSRAAFERAARIARDLSSGELLVAAAVGVGAISALKFTASSRCDAAPDLLREALAAIPLTDSTSRARILSRLALHSLSIGARCDALDLSATAVSIARLTDDPETLAHALTARNAVLFGPDLIEERSAIADEVLAIGRRLGNREFTMRGYALRFTVSFELGDIETADAAIEAHGRLAEETADPFERWANLVWRGERALLEGRFDEAVAYARCAMDLARDVPGPHTADHYGPVSFAAQTLLILDARHETPPDMAVVAHYRSRFPEISAWQVVNLARLVRIGAIDELRQELVALGKDRFADFERNGTWLAAMTWLSEAIELAGDRERAAVVYPVLLPFADRIATVSHIASRGSVSRSLGLLAATMQSWDESERHFQAANAMHRRMGARPHVALTCHDHARMLLQSGMPRANERARQLATEALGHARDLGMTGLIDRCEKLLARPGDGIGGAPLADGSEFLLVKQGRVWTLSHGEQRILLKDAKGFVYLAELLRRPHSEVHALELLALFTCVPEAARSTELRPNGHGDEKLDVKARRAYRRRLDTLHADLETAVAGGDPERTLELREEIAALECELARAVGLGGRSRPSSDAERARISVTRTIRLALSQVVETAPELGARLARSIRTGTFCCYEP